MRTILDLPIHPLAVHAPVVFVPLLVFFGIVYLLVPPLRQRIGWIVAALALIAPATVAGAIWSGLQLADFTYGDNWPEAVQNHHDYGIRLLWIVVGAIPVLGLFGALERGRRAALARDNGDGEGAASGDDPAAKGRKLIMLILGLIALALLALAAWMVFQAGHSGSEMKWGFIVDSNG